MKENKFQKDLILELKEKFPDCIILKNDSSYCQGIPDLSIFYKDKWAMLECKSAKDKKRQPNQEYYVNKLNKMSYASFIYPENKKEVLHELERTFES